MFSLFIILLITGTLCHVDPECHMNTIQIIDYNGLDSETHHVTTMDGYILELHRIPTKNPKGVFLLQHGLLDSSATWVMNTYNDSLGFVLAAAGYDVWLGNVRGSFYSMKHKTLSPKDPQFWDFSFEEMAKYDLPSMVDYVIKNSESNGTISYVGHSQGTLMGFIEFSRNKVLAKQIKTFFALAPVGRINNVTGLFTHMSHYFLELVELAEKKGIYDFAPLTPLLGEFGILVCPEAQKLCSTVFFVIAGPDKYLNSTRIPVYGSHAPAGTSMKNMVHWNQMYMAKRPQMWDYGSAALNLDHYNSTIPPCYDYTEFEVPSVFFSGENDYLGDPEDLSWLISQIPKRILKKSFVYEGYAHLSCLWATNAKTRVFDKIVSITDTGSMNN